MSELEILEVERFGRAELLAALKRTRLSGFGGRAIYQDASLEVAAAVDTARLAPAQRYVLRPGVEKILALREALLEHDVDVFALDGGVWIHTSDDPDERIPVIPPVAEESVERDGRRVQILSDGMHRVYAARSLGLPINVVSIRGVPPEYPYYAYALDDGWAGVTELDELPDGFQKKEYRNPDGYRALFRMYNDVFPGVQEKRRETNPEHLRA
jgi:hypothetical protein